MIQESSSDEDKERRNGSNEKEEEFPLFVQGLCDVVVVRIDNSRPTEEQFDERDFLDEERSGDEDWDGDDGEVVQDGYAW